MFCELESVEETRMVFSFSHHCSEGRGTDRKLKKEAAVILRSEQKGSENKPKYVFCFFSCWFAPRVVQSLDSTEGGRY